MRSAAAILAGVAMLMAIHSGAIRAQDTGAVIRAQVDLVNVTFSALDGKGRHVGSLTLADVEVYEDGVRQSINFFGPASESTLESLTVAMLVDASGSVRDKLSMEQKIAQEFLQKLLQPARDRLALIAFSDEIELLQDFTGDVSLLNTALQGIRAAGSTKLFDAIYVASEEKLKQEAGRKVMIVLSDGKDTASLKTRKEAIDNVQRNDIAIFAVGVKSAGFPEDFSALKDFARQTGGRFFESKVNVGEISAAFRQILETLRQQYDVSYYSTNPKTDGMFRRVEIRLNKKKGIRVQHRLGYYARRSIVGDSRDDSAPSAGSVALARPGWVTVNGCPGPRTLGPE